LETLKVIDGKIGTIMRKQYPIKEFIPKKMQIRKRLKDSQLIFCPKHLGLTAKAFYKQKTTALTDSEDFEG
jgi:hypothetical protein